MKRECAELRFVFVCFSTRLRFNDGEVTPLVISHRQRRQDGKGDISPKKRLPVRRNNQQTDIAACTAQDELRPGFNIQD